MTNPTRTDGDSDLATEEHATNRSESRANELALQWKSVRAHARAARLEARAAEIELELRRIQNGESPQTQTQNQTQTSSPHTPATATLAQHTAWAEHPAWAEVTWQRMLDALSTPTAPAETTQPAVATTEPASDAERPARLELRHQVQSAKQRPADSQRKTATNASSPHRHSRPATDPAHAIKKRSPHTTARQPRATPEGETSALKKSQPNKSQPAQSLPNPAPKPASLPNAAEPRETPRRRRPAAWLASCTLHVALLLLLGTLTLSARTPRDQLTLSAAPDSPQEEPMERIELEPVEDPQLDSSDELPSLEPAPDSIKAADLREFELTTPRTTLPTSLASPVDAGASLGGAAAGSTMTDLTTQFFGVAGGGNHFVYLVDNSGSMDSISPDGFEVARAELLRAIDQLTEKQRFYVIFFGEETFRMRLSDPNTPEPRAVFATPENKAALRRWAATIRMQPGRWPEEALEFAFKLRPDCVFLLTDGEMSRQVVPMIARSNIVDTLLDGPKPRSIIHTVGFHNREGEAQLREIARANGGSYRYVPPIRTGRR